MNDAPKIPITPPPSAKEATYRSIKHGKMILHFENNNKISSILFSNGKTKPKRQWKYHTLYPKLSSHSLSKLRCTSIVVAKKPSNSNPITPIANIVITPLSEHTESECDYSSSSSFATYPITSTPKITHVHKNYKKINVSNTIPDDSTDYDLSDSDDISSVNNEPNYPWPISSDDSFANLSDREVFKKLRERLCPEQPTQSQLTISATNEENKNKHATECKNDNVDEDENYIDPKWYDAKNGKYLSFIIHETPICENENEIGYLSEYEGDNEDENDMKQINTHLFVAMPLQSASSPVESDGFVCNLTDLDE